MANASLSVVKAAGAKTMATGVIICGLVLTGVFLPSDGVVGIFSAAAFGVGISLGLATVIEGRAGVRNLMRVDILMLWVLYGLTLLEFLFPQPQAEALLTPEEALQGTYAVLIGFAGLCLGRLLISRTGPPRKFYPPVDLRPTMIFLLFVVATLVGYLHIFLAVGFDPFEVVRQISMPRFTQSWSRGQYGDVYALLYELGALIYLIPPIAGLVLAGPKKYSFPQKSIVVAVLLFTFYYGFASGTRNVFATYVISFTGIYLLAKPQIKLRQALALGVPMVGLLFFATVYMLEFRTTGLNDFSFAQERDRAFFVDYNIVNVSRLTGIFPSAFGYLGLEIPINALIRPIPRILWAGKPEGLSLTLESALGASSGMTLSCTFIGEAYMAGGLFGVLIAGLFFGAAAERWNRVGNANQQFSQLLYVSGFLCAVLAMRSMMSMVPLILPTVALWLFGKLFLSRASLAGTHRAVNRTNH